MRKLLVVATLSALIGALATVAALWLAGWLHEAPPPETGRQTFDPFPSAFEFLLITEANVSNLWQGPGRQIFFDINGDRYAERFRGWPETGLIPVVDRNGDGRIDGTELVTDFKVLEEATRERNKHLLLWLDADRNAVSEPSELRPAREILATVSRTLPGTKMVLGDPSIDPDSRVSSLKLCGGGTLRGGGRLAVYRAFVFTE